MLTKANVEFRNCKPLEARQIMSDAMIFGELSSAILMEQKYMQYVSYICHHCWNEILLPFPCLLVASHISDEVLFCA